MKVKLLILTTAVLAFGQSHSEPLNDFHNVQSVSTSTTTAEPPVKHPDCPRNEDPKHTTFLPYPNDCKKFYKCKNGLAIPMKCPSELHWSVRTSRCDWPENAGCDPNIKTTESPESTTEGPTSPTLAPPKKHELCPVNEDPKTPTYLPYPSDCSKFYRCLHGYAHLTACPSGLHWSIKLNRCDWPERAGCDPNIETTTENPIKTTTVAGTTETPIKHNACPKKDDPENPVYLPYPGNCSKFYKCNNGLARAESCPSGLHWNTKESRCDWPETADCASKSETHTDIQKLKAAPTKTLYKAKNKTNEDAPIFHKDCPDDYDPQNPALLPYPNDCTKFYKCVAKIAHPMKCPPGLHWSIELDRCDWPSVAKCSLDPSATTVPTTTPTPTTPTSTPTPTTPTSIPIPTTPTSTPTPTTPTSIPIPTSPTTTPAPTSPTTTPAPTKPPATKPPMGENVCKNAKDNELLPHPKDCTKYVQCFNGSDYVKECPSGLQWNQKINYCDYPENVKCHN